MIKCVYMMFNCVIIGTWSALGWSFWGDRQMGRRFFSVSVVRSLAKKGITVIGSVALPNESGSFASGLTGYKLDDNGCHRIRTYFEVLEMAA